MKSDPLARSPEIFRGPETAQPDEVLPARAYGARRISFFAWGAALAAGALIWMLILQIV